MTDKHHYQRIDVENGCIQITRDDTDETQELRINAYGKDGTLIKSARHLYNIKYSDMDICNGMTYTVRNCLMRTGRIPIRTTMNR